MWTKLNHKWINKNREKMEQTETMEMKHKSITSQNSSNLWMIASFESEIKAGGAKNITSSMNKEKIQTYKLYTEKKNGKW